MYLNQVDVGLPNSAVFPDTLVPASPVPPPASPASLPLLGALFAGLSKTGEQIICMTRFMKFSYFPPAVSCRFDCGGNACLHFLQSQMYKIGEETTFGCFGLGDF